jgi:hypothetical protein
MSGLRCIRPTTVSGLLLYHHFYNDTAAAVWGASAVSRLLTAVSGLLVYKATAVSGISLYSGYFSIQVTAVSGLLLYQGYCSITTTAGSA